jgi:Chlorite dismutase
MAAIIPVSFVGSDQGTWRVERMRTLAGPALAEARAITMVPSHDPGGLASRATWILRGTTSQLRYTERAEAAGLRAVQAGLGRPGASRAALIPIRKSDAWWDLAQDERRAIFEDQSRHIAGTLKYVQAIARRLHHSRDLGEPFDFVTWFEYAPVHDSAFEDLVAMLRATPEWTYVDREVDIRLSLARAE